MGFLTDFGNWLNENKALPWCLHGMSVLLHFWNEAHIHDQTWKVSEMYGSLCINCKGDFIIVTDMFSVKGVECTCLRKKP